jgi:hypothetical protein
MLGVTSFYVECRSSRLKILTRANTLAYFSGRVGGEKIKFTTSTQTDSLDRCYARHSQAVDACPSVDDVKSSKTTELLLYSKCI